MSDQERKSSRARKAVKYTNLDEESDDDFAEKPSKSKKQKSNEDVDKVKSKQHIVMENMSKDPIASDEPNSIRKRKSMTDKLYEKQLEEALQLSIHETSGSENLSGAVPDESALSVSTPTNNMQVEVEVAYSKAPELIRVEKVMLPSEREFCDKEPPPLLPINSSTIGTVMDDSIESIENKVEQSNSRRHHQRRAAKKSIIIHDDSGSEAESDFDCGSQPDSDDNDNDGDEENFSPNDDDDDSDFDDGRRKKGKENKKKASSAEKTLTKVKTDKSTKKISQKNNVKAAPKTTKVTAIRKTQDSVTLTSPKTNVINSPTLTPTTQISSHVHLAKKSNPAATSKPKTPSPSSASSSVKRSTERLSQSWKPPGQASGDKSSCSPIIRSPSSGLRLGLSRNQRVKPLHSGVKAIS